MFDSYRFMQDSLLNLVDNLSEIDNKIIASEIDNKVFQATLMKKFLRHINYVIKILINLLCY